MAIGTIGFFVLAVLFAVTKSPWGAFGCLLVSYALYLAITNGYYHQ